MCDYPTLLRDWRRFLEGFLFLRRVTSTTSDAPDELKGETEVAFEDVFSKNSHWDINSAEDFEAIPKDVFDDYVNNNSELGS